MLQQVADVFGNLRARDSGVDTLLELVELVEHEQDPSRAGRLDRRRDIDLERFEGSATVGEDSVQGGAEGQLERPAGFTFRQSGEPGFDAGVAEDPTRAAGEQPEDVARSDAGLRAVALDLL